MSSPGPPSNDVLHAKSFLFFEVFIDGSYHSVLTENLAKIDIRNNLDNCYPIIQLFFYSDNQVFIQDNIYPQKRITVNVWYTDEEGNKEPDPIIFDLVVLQHDVQLPSKRYNNVSDHQENQRRITCATCVCRTPFKLMSCIVNRLWESTVTPYDAVMQLIEDVKIQDKIVKPKGKNCDKLDQLLIPPMSFNDALNHINNMYGIYDNEVFKYCDWQGTFKMWDMKEYFDENKGGGNITLHKLPIYGPSGLVEPPTKKAKTSFRDYVTYDYASTTNRIVDSFIPHGYKQTYIYHPAFDITYYINKQMASEFVSHGNIHGSANLKQDGDALGERYMVHNDDIGMMKDYYAPNPSEHLINRRFSRESLSLNYVKFDVNRKIKIHDLMKVGNLVYFKPYSEHEKYNGASYEGSYMMIDSHIVLNRFRNGFMADTVIANATILAARTNQSYT